MKNKISITLLSFFLILNLTGVSSAQVKSDSWLWTLNLGYTPVTSKISGNSLRGYTFNTTLEKHIGGDKWAYGFNLAYSKADDEVSELSSGDKVYSSVSSTSIFMTVKYFLSSDVLVPYLGFGLGLNFANNEYASANTGNPPPSGIAGTTSFTSLAFAVPIGLNWFAHESVFFGANIVPIWTDKTFFDSNFNWLFNFSLGFQF